MIKLIELYYDSFDLACIIHSLDMGTKTASIMLEKIWKEDNQYLSPYYRTNLRQLYLDVHYWTDYLCDKPVIDKEFPAIQKDFRSFGKDVEEEAFITDYFDIDLFFKMKLKYLRECMMFYHMQTYLRGKEECDIGEIGLDEMITIRVL